MTDSYLTGQYSDKPQHRIVPLIVLNLRCNNNIAAVHRDGITGIFAQRPVGIIRLT
jgi:hypothetical protein